MLTREKDEIDSVKAEDGLAKKAALRGQPLLLLTVIASFKKTRPHVVVEVHDGGTQVRLSALTACDEPRTTYFRFVYFVQRCGPACRHRSVTLVKTPHLQGLTFT